METGEYGAISPRDRGILVRLADEYAAAAADPGNATRGRLWAELNENRAERPMVWINEIPWHELDSEGELTLRCAGELAKEWEFRLRKILYQWRHMPCDMIVSPWFEVTKSWTGGSFRLDVLEKTIPQAGEQGISSHEFVPQIEDEKDVERLVRLMPASYDRQKTELAYGAALEAFGQVLPVKLRGVRHIWYTPWDNLIRVWGVQQAMMDLVLQPDLVNLAVGTYVSEALKVLDSFGREGLLSIGTTNVRVGSGGYGNMADSRAGNEAGDGIASPSEMWGCSNAQIFSGVSPEMHWEFALRHDIPWLSRWGYNYYGCCEALHAKHEQVRRIPKLRKISMSPWADLDEAIRNYGNAFVFSWKPNPAVFVDRVWNPGRARTELRQVIRKTREAGVSLEIIMKDISTVLNEPRRLHEWAAMAMEEALAAGDPA